MILKSTRQCERILFNYNHEFECKCGSTDEPINLSGFVRVCRNCKRKYSVTNGTIFHNVRFGLLKAFRIVIREYNNSFTSTSTEITKEFKITQKTAWKFLNKVRSNKKYIINLMEFVIKTKNRKKRARTSKTKKLLKNYFEKHNKMIEKLR